MILFTDLGTLSFFFLFLLEKSSNLITLDNTRII